LIDFFDCFFDGFFVFFVLLQVVLVACFFVWLLGALSFFFQLSSSLPAPFPLPPFAEELL
jgi:hypothetical protein